MSILSTFIVPHPPVCISSVGQGKELEIKDTVKAYHEVGSYISQLKPDTIIIISPHSNMYADYFHISPEENASGNMGKYGAKDVSFNVKYDTELAEKISYVCNKEEINAGGLGKSKPELDFGTMVPLHFIDKYYKDYQLVRISITDFSPLVHYNFGRCIQKACSKSKKRIVIIASGDLSHRLKDNGPYTYTHEGPIFDSAINEILKTGDFLKLMTFSPKFVQKASSCALLPMCVMAGCLDGYNVEPHYLSYDDVFGVGHAICYFDKKNKNPSRKFADKLKKNIIEDLKDIPNPTNPYSTLARKALETYILKNEILEVDDVKEEIPDELLNESSGIFVSLKREGKTRGCMGTLPTEPNCIADDIIINSLNAAFNDPRFNPVSMDELPLLEYHVDILSSPEIISSINELDIKKYGIIVSTENKKGLLLPNLNSITSTSQQLSIALSKAGISPNETYIMERFEVVRYI